MITKTKSSKTTSAKKVASKTTTVSRAWSKKEDSALIKALNAGHSAVETATMLGRTVAAVWNRKFNLKSTYKSAAKKSFRSNTLPMVVKVAKVTPAKKATSKAAPVKKAAAKITVKAKASVKKSTTKKSSSKK